MEEIEKAYYQTKFENAFLKAKGNAFQTFFNELMAKAYKEDYMPCRPWGSDGDKKNDGFLKSEKRLFQVYAPNEMSKEKAIEKINDDFEGAKKYWKKYFEKWSFVHNAQDGIPPHVQEMILELESNNSGIKLDLWGLEELRDVFQQLSKDDLESWFGSSPKSETKARIGFEDIRVVIETIVARNTDHAAQVKNVPTGKIEANQLSEAVARLIKEGMSKAFIVDEFFSKWHDPALGEKIAVSFRKKYEDLRKDFTPNEIFYELQAWVGGDKRGTAEHEMAVLTVLVYYFESCDIFEAPRG